MVDGLETMQLAFGKLHGGRIGKPCKELLESFAGRESYSMADGRKIVQIACGKHAGRKRFRMVDR